MPKRAQHRSKRFALPHHLRFDLKLFSVIVFLLILGIVFVYEASLVDAYHQFGDQYYFAKFQFYWATLGVVVFTLTSLINVHLLKRLALPLLLVSVISLILVLIPGVGNNVKGATRWLDLGIISFQPSELTKLTLVIYFSTLFARGPKLSQFLITLAVILGLIMLQPDLGTTISIAIVAFGLYFAAGGRLTHLSALLISAAGLAMTLILTSDYRKQRLLTFLNPEADPLGASYHIRQIILALGTGGFLGTGFGKSLQKYRFLPEATTDSIFAVIAEETGFIGTLVILYSFLFIAQRGFAIARNLADPSLKLLAVGTTMIIVTQAFLNLAAMSALVPLTGITLPFISYGGSSLLISLTSAGILLNLSRHTHQS